MGFDSSEVIPTLEKNPHQEMYIELIVLRGGAEQGPAGVDLRHKQAGKPKDSYLGGKWGYRNHSGVNQLSTKVGRFLYVRQLDRHSALWPGSVVKSD
jgi:hypothetical protein